MTSPPAPRRTPLRAGTAAGGVAPGQVLRGRYRLESLIASGGMAQVWEGVDEVLQRRVAVKVLHTHLAADATFVARFRQEAVAAARLAHPGIVSIYDTCSDNGVEAIVMELVVGRTLRNRLDDPTPLDPWQAAGIAAQVAEALDAAHRGGLVHRDVKPANVLLCGDGRVKVADFGIAKAAAEADLTQPGLMVGTAKYLAPEQVQGDPVDPRTDIYSLGIVLYEMLCGRAPFNAETDAATALARLHRDPLRPRQVRAGVPRALEDVVCRAMARDPNDRYDSAADLRAALLASGATGPEADPTAATHTPAPAPTAAAPHPTRVGDAAPPSRAEPAPAPSFAKQERALLIPTIIVVVIAVALGVAGLLLSGSGAGGFLEGVRDALGRGDGEVVRIGEARAFDPLGDQSEHDGEAQLAIDGDATTFWRTDRYNNRDITLLKDGVGLILDLDTVQDLGTLEIDSATNDWRARFYVAESPQGSLEGWGEPVDAEPQAFAPGPSSVDLRGRRGGAVLIWIVDAGDTNGRVEIREARVRAD